MTGHDTMLDDIDDSQLEDPIVSDDFEMTAMLDVLQTLGVDIEVGNRFCVGVIHAAQKIHAPSVIEAYGTGNIVNMVKGTLRNLNVDGLDAFDLRTNKNNGVPWDLCKAAGRKEAVEYVRKIKPTWIVGSPPCTPPSRTSCWGHELERCTNDEAFEAEEG